MSRTIPLRLAPVAAALALAGMSSAAFAVDFGGYFRAGAGSTNVDGKSRQCYGLAGPGLKYRLGNECDIYGEFLISQGFKQGGVDYKAAVMIQTINDNNDTRTRTDFNQIYVEGKGFDFAPTASFWIGKRFYGRADVHITDTFFVNMSGAGGGVDDIDLGVGKLNIAYFGTDGSADADNAGSRINLDLHSIAANPGGKLRLSATFVSPKQTAATTSGTPPVTTPVKKGDNGVALSLQHDQDNLFGMGLNNRAWLQYAKASAGLDQNFGDREATSDVNAWRIVESFHFQSGALGGQAQAAYQQDEAADGKKTKLSTIGGRISYGLTKNLKFLTELGYSQRKPDGGDTQKLTKLTFGPALSTGPDFWTRPELRLYVTTAKWNDAAGADAANGLPTGKKSATSFGVQAEIWF